MNRHIAAGVFSRDLSPERRIRVLYPFVGDDVGGSHISALKLIENLDKSLFQPVIALHDTNGLLASYLKQNKHSFVAVPDVPVPSAPAVKGAFGILSAIFVYARKTMPRLRRFLREMEIDIVHTNDGRIHTLWAPATAGSRARLVWHHRGDPTARGVNLLAPLLADHIVTVSRFAKPLRPLRNIDRRWTVVHSPFDRMNAAVDADSCRAALRQETGAGKDALFLGYFGGLFERKKPVEMAEIISACLKRDPTLDIHAVLFGRPAPGGPALDQAVLDRARELGIADRVHLMGFRQPVEPWLKAVDILAVPALNEPFGRTLIEAMLLGTPVVATRHGGNPEAITDGVNGFLVEPGDPVAFVDPVRRLLSDPELYQKISETAREMALHNYGTEKHVAAITDIYKLLMSRDEAEKEPA
jgi:glycosyltransferase involved in cell wall biosynthesis